MQNRRIERKWVFRKVDHLLVLNSLLRSQFFFKYHYPSRRVNSIYYDDINLSNIAHNLYGISNRVKYRVRWYGSNSDNLKKNYSNGGLYLVSNKLLLKKIMLNKSHQKNISLEEDIIPLLLRNNNFYGFVSKNIFIDIGIPEDYKLSANILKEEICLIQTK